MLGKKAGDIDEEISLLHELKEIVLDFIRQIEKADFGKDSDVKLLYEKAKEIRTQLVNVDCNGNPAAVNRLWTVKDDVTEADTCPYEMIEYPGGLYAAAVSIDGDGESHNKVREKTAKWLENTNFVIDSARELMGHMIYVDDEIKEGLGYHQMTLYTPIRLKKI